MPLGTGDLDADEGGVTTALAQSIKLRDIHPFDSLPRPGRFAEKREARFHARIVQEAPHRQATAQLSPAMAFHQFGEDGLQCHAV